MRPLSLIVGKTLAYSIRLSDLEAARLAEIRRAGRDLDLVSPDGRCWFLSRRGAGRCKSLRRVTVPPSAIHAIRKWPRRGFQVLLEHGALTGANITTEGGGS